MSRSSVVVWALVATGLVGLLMCGLCVGVIPPAAQTYNAMVGLRDAVRLVARRTGRVPTSLGGLPAADGRAPTTSDGWGRPITLRIEADGQVTLISLGADGRPGGDEDGRDLIGTFDPRGRGDEWTRDPYGRVTTRPATRP